MDTNYNNPFSPKRPAVKISKTKADKLVSTFLENKTKGNTKAVFFGKDSIAQLLKGRRPVGFRVYFGETENGNLEAVLVGVDSKGDNIVKNLPKTMMRATTNADSQGDVGNEESSILISDVPCPNMCPNGNTEIGG